MSSTSWQRLRVPMLERLALADMAMRRGENEEDALARIIREAAKRTMMDDVNAESLLQELVVLNQRILEAIKEIANE